MLNYLFALKVDGKFVLRIEDTDQTRFVPEALKMLQVIIVEFPAGLLEELLLEIDSIYWNAFLNFTGRSQLVGNSPSRKSNEPRVTRTLHSVTTSFDIPGKFETINRLWSCLRVLLHREKAGTYETGSCQTTSEAAL